MLDHRSPDGSAEVVVERRANKLVTQGGQQLLLTANRPAAQQTRPAIDGPALRTGADLPDLIADDKITLLDSLILPEGARAVWLTLEVTQPQATAWSEAEHRVAWQQFPLPTWRSLGLSPKSPP